MRRRMGQRAAYESLMRKKNMIMNTAALEDSGDEETPGLVFSFGYLLQVFDGDPMEGKTITGHYMWPAS